MHKIDLLNTCEDSLDSTILYLIGLIHEYKGRECLYNLSNRTIVNMYNNSLTNSIIYSNKIEGIITTPKALNNIINNTSELSNRSDQEIAGYKDVLELINTNYENIDISTNTILYLHKQLYKYTNISLGGKFKPTDNVIEEKLKGGKSRVRFNPVPAYLTKDYMDDLCDSYNKAINSNIDPLLIIPIFILDFLCIHPFNDGNGRMSRLLTILLLYKNGFNISKYISIEESINESRYTYYDKLEQSSIGWHDNKNNYKDFIIYYLNIILSSYIEVDMLVSIDNMKIIDKVEYLIKESVIPISKNDIYNHLSSSMISIERSLNELLNKKVISKVGQGRSTKYKYNKR